MVRGDRVRGRVRFVEAVARELQNEVEEFLGVALPHALGDGALEEVGFRGVDSLLLLLADRLDERVRVAQGDAAQFVADLHDLLLVHHHAVGLFGEAIDDRVNLRDLLLPVLAPVVGGDEVHRSRAEERVGGDQVLETVGLHLGEEPPHAARFELEHARRVGATEALEHARVVVRKTIEIERIARATFLPADGLADRIVGERRADQVLGALDDAERAQTQEVHLEQADLLAGRAVPLGDDIVGAGRLVERDDLVQRSRGDDDARGVDRRVADLSLERATGVEQFLRALVRVVHRLEVGLLLERDIDGDIDPLGDEFRDLVDLGERDVHHPPDVADRGARLQRSEGDDLRDMPVLLTDIVDDIAAAVLTQIDIDVGVFGAVGIGESLEEQTILDGARVREAERVADHRPDARATGHRRHAALAAPVHEVPHDQEVRRDRLVGEDLEFALEALPDRALLVGGARLVVGVVKDGRPVAPDQTGVGEVAKGVITLFLEFRLFLVVGRRVGVKWFEREVGAERLEPRGEIGFVLVRAGLLRPHDAHDRRVVAQFDIDIAPLGDGDRVVHGLRAIAEQFAHLLGRFDEQLFRVAQAGLVGLDLAHRDAAQRVVRVPVLFQQEVGVVVADQRQIEFARQALQMRIDRLLLGHMALEFDEEPRLTVGRGLEGLGVPLRALDRVVPVRGVLGLLILDEVVREFRAEVAVDRDQPVEVAREEFLVDARLVVEAGEVRL